MGKRAASVEHSTQSNYEAVTVTHADLDLVVDFSAKTISGTAQLKYEVKRSGCDALILDTRDLAIQEVSVDGAACQFTLASPHKALGSALSIPLPAGAGAGSQGSARVRFATSPASTALQWLSPAQTAGGKHPYLFTQCQAIHARSLVPCQDTPGAKLTYAARVRVPEVMTALMSAVPVDEAGRTGQESGDGTRMFSFAQQVPIPSYLLALAVGQLESRELGPVSRVYSEPSMVAAGAYEFAETDAFLQAAASVAGPYVWGRYDLLLLPPSFPYGGMENPCLTFVTPTLLAGDRSLANVVAHEIAHSWTGNLVTNASWEHFWLNEGWTMWLERRILAKLYGEATYEFHASLGYLDLREAVETWGAGHDFTCLVPDLSGGIDPDDAFSTIPYEKGFYFLHYLQTLVGGPEVFEAFFKDYIKAFSFKTVTSDGFKAYFLDYFTDSTPGVGGIDWDLWFYQPGMPPNVNSYDASLAESAYALAQSWHTSDLMGLGTGSTAGPAKASTTDLDGWSASQKVAFLDKLGELRSMKPFTPATTRRMQELYHFDDSKNAELRRAWYSLCIKAGDLAILPQTLAFLSEQGRMKYLRPLYRALYANPKSRQAALDTFATHREMYHPIAAKMVATDLQVPAAV
ncbi:LTA4 [Auxenochlorella protothecoides x Auxenochlorella symbiontica]